MKRKIALLMVMSFVFVTGCASGGGDAPEKESAGGEGGDALNLLIVSDLEPLQPVFEEYGEETGVTVNVESVPYDEIFETIEVRMGTQEDSIDVLVADAPLITNYTAKGYLAGLSDYVEETSLGNITEASLEGGTVDGEVMALPLYSSCVNLYYNKALFDEKGVDYPSYDVEERMTWEEVVDLAEQLTYKNDEGTQIYGMTFEQIDTPYQLLPLSQSLGAEQYISDDQTTTDGYTNSEEVVKAMEFYGDTFNEWGISPKIDGSESTSYFCSSQIAMFVGGSWNIASFDEAGVDWGVAPHPYFEGGEAVTPTGSWYMGVSAYSKNTEAAAKFVEWLTTDDGTCQKTYDIMQNLPCNISVLDAIEADPENEGTPAALNVYEAKNTAMARPGMVGYEEWQSVLQETYSDVKNGADAQEALDSAVEEIDSLIEKYQK